LIDFIDRGNEAVDVALDVVLGEVDCLGEGGLRDHGVSHGSAAAMVVSGGDGGRCCRQRG
jgi:hypothetical protein